MKKPIAAKKTYIYVKPATKKRRGSDEATMLKIRDPRTGMHIPAHGAKVELTTVVARMILVPKPNRPRAPRLHRGPDLVKISKEDFDKGLEEANRAAEAKSKKAEKVAAKAAKKAGQESEDANKSGPEAAAVESQAK